MFGQLLTKYVNKTQNIKGGLDFVGYLGGIVVDLMMTAFLCCDWTKTFL